MTTSADIDPGMRRGERSPMRALVIQHEESIPAAIVDEWLTDRGAEIELHRVITDTGDRDPRAYDLIVTLGSEAAAYDDAVPWIARERKLLGAATDAGVPVLGICFGSQLLARVLGGRAMRAERSEIGWMKIRTHDRSLVGDGPWLLWHHDTFTVPDGAALLADSPAGPQAFMVGRSLGIQFHPEVTAELVGRWVTESRDELERERVDADRLLARARELDRENRVRALALFDAFLVRVARIGAAA